MKIFALALLMSTLTVPVAAGQPPDPTGTDAAVTELVQDYVRLIENDEVSLMVVHLNDLTTDAFFSAPTKYSLRAQARQNTMFFVSGVAKQAMSLDIDSTLVQTGPSGQEPVPYRTVAVNISNFEVGASLREGEEFQGVISTVAQEINLRAPFEVRIGEFAVQFELSMDAVNRIQ